MVQLYWKYKNCKSRPWINLMGVRNGREKALYFRMAT